MNRKKAIRKDKSKKDKAQEKSGGVVTVPYVHSFTKKIQHIFTKHRVATVVKPQTTLRQVLVHPKDKVDKQKKAGVVYKIPCNQSEKTEILYFSPTQSCSRLGTGQTTCALFAKGNQKLLDISFGTALIRIHSGNVLNHIILGCENN